MTSAARKATPERLEAWIDGKMNSGRKRDFALLLALACLLSVSLLAAIMVPVGFVWGGDGVALAFDILIYGGLGAMGAQGIYGAVKRERELVALKRQIRFDCPRCPLGERMTYRYRKNSYECNSGHTIYAGELVKLAFPEDLYKLYMKVHPDEAPDRRYEKEAA